MAGTPRCCSGVGLGGSDMAFRYKDLLVTVLPPGLRMADCTNDTHCGGACSNQHSDCPGGCSNQASDFHTTHCNDWRVNPADLVELKVLLRHALERIELAEAGSPKGDVLPAEAGEHEELAELVGASLKELEATREKLPADGFAGAFRVRDLMVTVLPTAESGGCDAGVSRDCPGGCSNSSTKFPSEPGTDRILPAELAQLQALLRLTVARAEALTVQQVTQLRDVEQADGLRLRLHGLAEALEQGPVHERKG